MIVLSPRNEEDMSAITSYWGSNDDDDDESEGGGEGEQEEDEGRGEEQEDERNEVLAPPPPPPPPRPMVARSGPDVAPPPRAVAVQVKEEPTEVTENYANAGDFEITTAPPRAMVPRSGQDATPSPPPPPPPRAVAVHVKEEPMEVTENHSNAGCGEDATARPRASAPPTSTTRKGEPMGVRVNHGAIEGADEGQTQPPPATAPPAFLLDPRESVEAERVASKDHVTPARGAAPVGADGTTEIDGRRGKMEQVPIKQEDVEQPASARREEPTEINGRRGEMEQVRIKQEDLEQPTSTGREEPTEIKGRQGKTEQVRIKQEDVEQPASAGRDGPTEITDTQGEMEQEDGKQGASAASVGQERTEITEDQAEVERVPSNQNVARRAASARSEAREREARTPAGRTLVSMLREVEWQLELDLDPNDTFEERLLNAEEQVGRRFNRKSSLRERVQFLYDQLF
jgi:hypothetical protein